MDGRRIGAVAAAVFGAAAVIGIASGGSAAAVMPLHDMAVVVLSDPGPASSDAIVVSDPGGAGDAQGPKNAVIVIGDPGGDGPGPE
jgi:hypothetical protein